MRQAMSMPRWRAATSWTLTLLAGAALLVGQSPILQNGSFEDGYTAWTASGQQLVAINDPEHPASSGTRALVFNPNNQPANGVVSQTFATVSGQRYELAMDLGTVGGINDRRLRLTVGGSGLLLSEAIDWAGLGVAPFYLPYRTSFVANSTSTTISLADATESHLVADTLIDNLRVAAMHPQAPVITTQPQRAAAGVGGDATFSVVASGPGPFSYRWQFNGTDITGATFSSYTRTSATPSSAGNYTVVVTNAFGSTISSAATLTVVPAAILLNGSFEYGSAAWNFPDYLLAEPTLNPAYTPSDGVQLMHFNYAQRASGGRIEQTFPTTPGQQYVLAFDVGAESRLNQDTMRMRVTVTGQGATPLLLQTVSVTAAGNGTTYLAQSFPFVADGPTATLDFEDISLTTLNVDLVLDNVRVTIPSALPVITQHPQSTSVLTGGSATFRVTATGATSYQWRFGGIPIGGATASSYTVTNAQASNAGSFDVVVSNGSASVVSNPATLTVASPSGFSNGSFEANYASWTATGNQQIASGGFWVATDGVKAVAFNGGQLPANAIVSQAFATTPGETYSLTFDAGAISGSNQQEQRLQVTVQGQAATPLLSSIVSLFAPGNGTRYVPQSFTFVPDSVTTTLTFRDVSTTSINVDLMLDNVRVGLQSAPTITAQPQSVTVNPGQPASFSVTATGQGPISYEWQLNGTPISGATASTYAIASAQQSDVGSYSVVVSNSSGSAQSAAATLTLRLPPVITTQPQSATVNAGSPVSFSVTTSGTAPLSYQWRFDGVTISGATSSTYSIASAQPSQAGSYTVVVSNAAGSVTSNAATLTVNTGFVGAFTNGSFESDYATWSATGNQEVVSGSFWVASHGVKAVAFNGGQTTPNGTLRQTFATTPGQAYALAFDVGAISGSNQNEQRLDVTVQGTATLLSQVASVFAPGNGTRYVAKTYTFVTDSTATSLTFRDVSATSINIDLMLDNVRVTGSSGLTITSQPQSQTVPAGGAASFSVTASGAPPLSYQWRKDGTNITGATSSTYSIANVQTSHAGSYDVLVSDSGGSVTSAAATLTVSGPPTITAHPQSASVAAAAPASFTVTATGTAPLSYQWRFNGGPINGAIASTYTIASVAASNAGTYDVVVSNAAGSVTSNPATLTVTTGGTVSGFANGSFEANYASWVATGNQAVVSGGFWVATNGVRTVAFNGGQLPATGVLSQTFATIAGQSYTLAFDVGAISGVNQNEQRLEVQVQGQATSPLLRQTVSVLAPGNGTRYVPQSFTFTADGPATTLTFTDRSPTTINVDLMLDNVRVTGAAAPMAPTITAHPQSVSTAVGSPASFSVTATGSAPLSYQWRFNGTPLSGATVSTYSIASAATSHGGSYDVVVSNSVGSATSNAATLTVTEPPPPTGFTNGSFESDYAGWNRSGNQAVVSGGFWATTNGIKAVAFNSGQATPNGVLSQTFATTAGQTYTLVFDMGALSGVNQSEQRMHVTVQGQGPTPLLSRTEAVFAPGNGTRYVAKSFTFVADGPSATLTFRDVSLVSVNVDLMLDNVRITP